MAAALQYGATALIAGLQATCAGSYPVAGCATRTSFAGHTGRSAKTRHALTLNPDHLSCDDIWHLDEVVITIAGRKHWLWRAVDQDGYVLDEIVQKERGWLRSIRLELMLRLLFPEWKECVPRL